MGSRRAILVLLAIQLAAVSAGPEAEQQLTNLFKALMGKLKAGDSIKINVDVKNPEALVKPGQFSSRGQSAVRSSSQASSQCLKEQEICCWYGSQGKCCEGFKCSDPCTVWPDHGPRSASKLPSGWCEPIDSYTVCKEEGGSCKGESPCCEGLQCDVGICKRKCSNVGGDCSLSDKQCCDGLRCNFIAPSHGFCELDTDVEPPPPETRCSKATELCSNGPSEDCPECGVIISCCEGLECRKNHCFTPK